MSRGTEMTLLQTNLIKKHEDSLLTDEQHDLIMYKINNIILTAINAESASEEIFNILDVLEDIGLISSEESEAYLLAYLEDEFEEE